jgi:uncharacterized membrane protein YhaH (DUF805 family)
MGAVQGANWLYSLPFILLMIIPGFLPLVLKRPEGPNRFGIPYEPKNVVDAVRACIDRYFAFNGRATRFEFWSFFLTAIAIQVVALSTAYVASFPFYLLTGMVLFLPVLAVSVRRLHDINRSGWWLLIGPSIGLVALIVLWLLPSQRGATKMAQRPRIVI